MISQIAFNNQMLCECYDFRKTKKSIWKIVASNTKIEKFFSFIINYFILSKLNIKLLLNYSSMQCFSHFIV